MLVWLDAQNRVTKDIDLLGLGNNSAEELRRVFTAICEQRVPSDDISFSTSTVRVAPIREQQEYGGMRVTLTAMLGKIKIPLQVDVGVGDAVVPAAGILDYPGLLDLPQARLRAYRPETSIAEKCEAMVRLASANSRMKDFCDVYALAGALSFDGDTLRRAVAATFDRRHTPISVSPPPVAFTMEFANDAQKRRQWEAFVRRNRLADSARDLESVIAKLAEFLGPVLDAVARGRRWRRKWAPNGPWKPRA